ncbi:interferon-related developmental regulator-domain-containing protein [Catenaria anguillulae PL171]|uniref:Interferon-related developmental regulator-domain-containing protein n=1 Tax=Catenaria anguillulae PL171 TaxID=765915 RepID=A0A1Y2HES4_9FUNG|nr:interferon-related developmental regulator-domain-containing protein [Catenaria anguillulae PL171]
MSKTARRLFKRGNAGSGYNSSAPASDAEFESDSDAGSVLSIDDYVYPFPDTPPGGNSDNEGDDDSSSGSGGAHRDLGHDLRAALDGLLEKRASTREDHLAKIIRLLGNHYMAAELDSLVDTALDALVRCAKKEKSQTENIAAAKALGIYFVTIGPGHESRYTEVVDTLLPLVTKLTAGRPEPVRCALSDLVTLACFTTGSADHTSTLLTTFADLAASTFRKLVQANEASAGNAALKAAQAAVSATSGEAKVTIKSQQGIEKLPGGKLLPVLLADLGVLCTVARPGAVRSVAGALGEMLLKVLGCTCVSAETKILAAENVAMLVEVGALDRPDDDNDHGNATSNTPASPSSIKADETVTADPATIVTRAIRMLTDLTSSSSTSSDLATSVKSTNQRDRKSQRAAFRDVLAYLESETPPHLKLKFRKEQVVLNTWAQLRQLYMFRAALGQSVHVHFLLNPLLRDVFDFHFTEDAGLSKAERKAMYNPSSEYARQRTQMLAKQRRVRASKIGQFD